MSHIRAKGEVPLNVFKPSDDFLLTVPRRCFFCGSNLLFKTHVCLYYAVLSVPCSIVVTCWEKAELLVLLCVLFSCNFVTFLYMVSVVLHMGVATIYEPVHEISNNLTF